VQVLETLEDKEVSYLIGVPDVVQLYPVPAGAARCDRFQVAAGAAAPFVERWRDVSYARFGVAGPVPIGIRAPEPVRELQVLPRAAVSGVTVDGAQIRFQLLEPANLVVRVDGRLLFLLADPPETDRPEPGAPGVWCLDAPPAGLATMALQAALDAAADWPGGGTVRVPAGTFRTGTLVLRGGTTLYLAPGAVLLGSDDPADFPVDPGRRESGTDATITAADGRYRGETMTFSRMLLVEDGRGARILGRGTLDGNGAHLRQGRNAVPNLIRVRGGRDIAIRDVLLRDAAAWTLHLLAARDVRVERIKIINDRTVLNTDGVDPDSCRDVAVRGCLIYTRDDAVCVKATRNSGLLDDVERIEVRGNVVSSLDAALKVGTETLAARFEDIEFRDNDIFESQRAMSIVVRDGASLRRIAFRDIRVGPGTAHLVEQVIGVRAGPDPQLGTIDQLLFEDITVEGHPRPERNRTWYAQFRPADSGAVFQGADQGHRVRGLTLRRVVVNGVRLTDAATADRVANLTLGPFVEDVAFG